MLALLAGALLERARPALEAVPSYDWDAAAQMARAELLVGVSLLGGPRPQWKPDSPFR